MSSTINVFISRKIKNSFPFTKKQKLHGIKKWKATYICMKSHVCKHIAALDYLFYISVITTNDNLKAMSDNTNRNMHHSRMDAGDILTNSVI